MKQFLFLSILVYSMLGFHSAWSQEDASTQQSLAFEAPDNYIYAGNTDEYDKWETFGNNNGYQYETEDVQVGAETDSIMVVPIDGAINLDYCRVHVEGTTSFGNTYIEEKFSKVEVFPGNKNYIDLKGDYFVVEVECRAKTASDNFTSDQGKLEVYYRDFNATSDMCVGDENGDGAVTINELVRAVNSALNGCGR